MSQERDRDSAGAGSRDNPIVIMDSPMKRLAPIRARSHTSSAYRGHLQSVPNTQSSTSTKRRKMSSINFELYSHATDKQRLIASVYSVAGRPLINESAAVDLSSDTQSESHSDDIRTVHQSTVVSPPFHKFSQGVLENMADSGLGNTDTLRGYLQLTEQLLAHGYHIPVNRVPQVINAVLDMTDHYYLHKVHSLLCQDLHLRPSTHKLPLDYLQDTLHTVSCILRHLPTHQSSQVVLQYIAGLEPRFGHMPTSLINNLLDVACVSVGVQGLTAITQTVLSLSIAHSSHCIAGDLSTRVNRLPSKHLKCALLRVIPNAQFRLKVINHHLTQYFKGPSQSGASCLSMNLQRVPYQHNGLPQDLSYLLSVQLLMLETELVIGSTTVDSVQVEVLMMLGQLQEDPLLVDELPTVWHHLQLLHALT